MSSRVILRVKTRVPPLGEHTVDRPDLLDRMDEVVGEGDSFSRPLTLVSAPAGFGKTTLVRQWLRGREDRAAWYSLDQADNEPQRFWAYVIHALQGVSPRAGQGPLEALTARSNPGAPAVGVESLLVPLLNDLLEAGGPLFLVLDDYHFISDRQIHEELVFFLENLPDNCHLAVTTRSDPPWPLARWRARRQVTDVRLQHLAFGLPEASSLLSQTHGVHLGEEELKALQDKTEGWPAGLQLAAVSLAQHSDPPAFIRDFAGTNRHILHFLSEEVFHRQTQERRDFLLQTSVVQRFTPSLCDALTGRTDSARVLAGLEGDNLFLLPLDQEATWYRYHPLFAELLQYHLERQNPELFRELQRRAGQWFLEAGDPAEAARHALAAGDREELARILNQHSDDLLEAEGPILLNRCLEELSEEILRDYPRLVAHKALHTLVKRGREEASRWLDLAQELQPPDPEEQAAFAGVLAATRAYFHICSNRWAEALEAADQALELLTPRDLYWRVSADAYSGDIRLFTGDPAGALPYYSDGYRLSQKAGNKFFLLGTAFKLGNCLHRLGRLEEARELLQRTLAMAREEGLDRLPRAGILLTLLGEIMRETGKLDEAGPLVEQGLYLSQPEKPSWGWNLLFQVALAFSRRQFQLALEALGQIGRLHGEENMPLFVTSAASVWEARIALEMAEWHRARELLSRAGVCADASPIGGKRWAFLVLAHLALSQGGEDLAPWRRQLHDIRDGAASGGECRVELEALLLLAWLEEQAGNGARAEEHLFSALELGQARGYYQVFVDEGTGLDPVWERLAAGWLEKENGERDRELADHARAVIAGREAGAAPEPRAPGLPPEAAGSASLSGQPLPEPLSPRELEILELIAQGLPNQEISRRLFLTLGTVKWHASNIYGKLGVRGRTRAAARARELGLLP